MGRATCRGWRYVSEKHENQASLEGEWHWSTGWDLPQALSSFWLCVKNAQEEAKSGRVETYRWLWTQSSGKWWLTMVAVKMKRSETLGLDMKCESKEGSRVGHSQDSVLKTGSQTFPVNLGSHSLFQANHQSAYKRSESLCCSLKRLIDHFISSSNS